MMTTVIIKHDYDQTSLGFFKLSRYFISQNKKIFFPKKLRKSKREKRIQMKKIKNKQDERKIKDDKKN